MKGSRFWWGQTVGGQSYPVKVASLCLKGRKPSSPPWFCRIVLGTFWRVERRLGVELFAPALLSRAESGCWFFDKASGVGLVRVDGGVGARRRRGVGGFRWISLVGRDF